MPLQRCTSSSPPRPPDAVFCESSPSRSCHDRQRRAKKTFEEMMSYIPGIPLTFFFPALCSLFATTPAANNSSVERQMWDVWVLAAHFIVLFCSDFVGKCIGEEAKYEGVRLLFDGLQQPVLNKQVHPQSHTKRSHTNPWTFRSTDVLLLILLRFWKYQKKSLLCWTCLQFFSWLAMFLITQSENLCCLQRGSEDTQGTNLCHLVYIKFIDVELWEEFPKCPFLNCSYSTCTCRHLPRLQSIGASVVTARPQCHRVIRCHRKLHAKSRVPPLF